MTSADGTDAGPPAREAGACTAGDPVDVGVAARRPRGDDVRRPGRRPAARAASRRRAADAPGPAGAEGSSTPAAAEDAPPPGGPGATAPRRRRPPAVVDRVDRATTGSSGASDRGGGRPRPAAGDAARLRWALPRRGRRRARPARRRARRGASSGRARAPRSTTGGVLPGAQPAAEVRAARDRLQRRAREAPVAAPRPTRAAAGRWRAALRGGRGGPRGERPSPHCSSSSASSTIRCAYARKWARSGCSRSRSVSRGQCRTAARYATSSSRSAVAYVRIPPADHPPGRRRTPRDRRGTSPTRWCGPRS